MDECARADFALCAKSAKFLFQKILNKKLENEKIDIIQTTPSVMRFHLDNAKDVNKFSKLPEMAFYWDDPAKLVDDSRKELVVNIEHMIQDNKARFPAPYNAMPDYNLQNYINGCINSTKEKLKRNYKLAVPQYFITTGTIQLLIPLCLVQPDVADLAIVVEDYGTMYRASTCLTLDMAINNARLLARPDRDWLNP